MNIEPRYPLDAWETFWRRTGAGEVLFAQDEAGEAIAKYRLISLGTEVLVGRDGTERFRSNGPVGYERLRSAVEEAL